MIALLDTHILLWWSSRDPRLSSAAEQVLRQANQDAPAWLSDITFWEIATLWSLGRIQLNAPLRDWLEQVAAVPGLRSLPISAAVAAEVASLPSTFQRDPADRLIVATARVLGATLVTADRRIIEAGLVPTLT